MKAIVLHAPNQYSLADVPTPQPPPGWARVRVSAAAFCATDIEALTGGIAARYPVTLGHEWCGVVDAVNGDARAWAGRRVVGSNDVCCLTCRACRSGMWRDCPEFGEIGFARDGAYAEYMLAPCYALRLLPDGISDIQAAMLEPLGVAIGTLDKAQAKLGETLLIFGAGSIGLNVLAAARAAGLRKITVIDRAEDRLAVARAMGADFTLASEPCDAESELRRIYATGPDIAVDCTGAEQCIQLALRAAPKSGRVALAGYGRGLDMTIHIDDVHIKNLRVTGAGNNWNVLDRCIDLVADGVISTERLCTNTARIEQFDSVVAAAAARAPGFIKAVFVFPAE